MRRWRVYTARYARAAAAKHMIEVFGATRTEVDLILVNGESVDFEHLPQDGQRVAVFPRFKAMDLKPPTLASRGT